MVVESVVESTVESTVESVTESAPEAQTETSPPRPAIRFGSLVIDTDDPERLARFYSALLDVPIVDRNERWWTVRLPDGRDLDFQLVISYRPPTWSSADVPQQFHLDLMVDDLTAAMAYAESLGARRIEPLGGTSVGFVDPSGHPFCLCGRGGG